MSIERHGNKYELQCDFCSNSIDDFLDFQEAVDYKKANNWKSSKINDEWFDKCPHCKNGIGLVDILTFEQYTNNCYKVERKE